MNRRTFIQSMASVGTITALGLGINNLVPAALAESNISIKSRHHLAEQRLFRMLEQLRQPGKNQQEDRQDHAGSWKPLSPQQYGTTPSLCHPAHGDRRVKNRPGSQSGLVPTEP